MVKCKGLAVKQKIEAIYEKGILRPLSPLTGLKENQHVQVEVETQKPPHPLLKHCGTVSDEDTAEIMKIIEDEFGKVDPDDWK